MDIDNSVSTFLRLFLGLQVFFVVVSAAAFFVLAQRIKQFDYSKVVDVSQEKFYERVSKATYDFLKDYSTNQYASAVAASTNSNIRLASLYGSVYGYGRKEILRFDGNDYLVGDLFPHEDKAYLIQRIDFAGQRIYCLQVGGPEVLVVRFRGLKAEEVDDDAPRVRSRLATTRGGASSEPL